MANISITEELLALYLEGKTTPEESALVLAAAQENTEIRNLIEAAIEDGMCWNNVGPMANPAAISVSKRQEIKSQNLPVMRLAALSEANDCVVQCERYVLDRFEHATDGEELQRQAIDHNWLRKEGTPLHHIGRLLELAGLSVARRFGGNLQTLQSDYMYGSSAIVALNADLLTIPNAKSKEANHAVVVLDINTYEGYIEVYDPQSTSPSDIYKIADFERAWKCSKCFFVSVIERGVRPYTPHPEPVSDIELPAEVAPLADILAENAHEIWARDRMAEYIAKGIDPSTDPFMKPFGLLTDTSDYLTSLNTLKLICKLGYRIDCPTGTGHILYRSNELTADGQYIPRPISVDDIELPVDLSDLAEYIAENAHEEWAQERISGGWSYADVTDKAARKSNLLVPYCELIDAEKDYDRKMAMYTIKVLIHLGYQIIRD